MEGEHNLPMTLYDDQMTKAKEGNYSRYESPITLDGKWVVDR